MKSTTDGKVVFHNPLMDYGKIVKFSKKENLIVVKWKYAGIWEYSYSTFSAIIK